MIEHQIARALGWFSIGLGAAELVAPRAVCRALDIDCNERLIQAFGARELAAGMGILSRRNPSPWMWGRVAGDAINLGALAAGLRNTGRRTAVAAAITGVAAVTFLDVLCGWRLSHRPSLATAAASS
jgi:hypothetical protein